MARLLLLLFACLAMPVAAQQPPVPAALPVSASVAAPPVRPADPGRRCTAGGEYCIALDSYIPDVCRTIEALSREHALDPGFFSRLIWRESLFDAGAVSPAGALGIAQFMPGTAKLRGLGDPFNPAEALSASAAYLAELAARFGNIGLAAVAYNAGEARAEKFLSGHDWLPGETVHYVQAITGVPALVWRDAPPETLDLALDAALPFRAACEARARDRAIREFRVQAPVLPWGVVLASAPGRAAVERRLAQLRGRLGAAISGEQVAFTRSRFPGQPAARHVAQIGRESRAEATALCARLRSAGGTCMVLKN
ncbi:lytic transglycosylase domain-containing protein [Limimaricola pyoseonensis]|uniref:Sporulation related domain-containing protein n=1 Tax=Limimaricola pyoseonensis TaxID=521013 RepID=A0A1G7F7L3_9RHOB|nr:lytic transglycosylase domain-containing protein [Limimaricola pyoseonensis]SDE71565.1 Sporulation related domain-containing protein [Limimaricola pyoseonensis]